MIRLTRPVVFCALVLAAVRGAAQPHNTGYLFTAQPSNAIAIGLLTPTGQVSTLITAQQVSNMFLLGNAVMDFDNLGIMAIYSDQNQAGLLRLDGRGNATKFPFGVRSFGPLPVDVRVNEDGNYDVVVKDPFNPPRYLEMDRSGSVRTLFPTPSVINPYSINRDPHTGDYFVHDAGIIFSQGRVLRYTPAGVMSTVTTMGGFSFNLRSDSAFDVTTGDVFFGSTSGLMRVSQNGQTTVVATGAPFSSTGPLIADRASTPGGRLVGGALKNATTTVFAWDIAARAATTLYNGPGLFNGRSLFPYLGRNVATIKRSAGLWEIALRFPGHGGRAYVAPLTLSGVRPGFSVDTRHIAFNVDSLTLATVNNALPIYRGGIGQLDANGFGTAILDVSSLPNVTGLMAQVIALVLDPSAPSGIALIADPRLIVL